MENNMFNGAKFGDLYITEDGVKNCFCSFTKSGDETLARLYREGWGIVIFYMNGAVHSGYEFGKGSIKGKYVESIDEERLQEIAYDNTLKFPILDSKLGKGQAYYKGFIDGFITAKQEKL